MYNLFQILQFNVHSVMQAVIKEQTFSMEPIGSALYSSIAFFNHSCNPNTIKYWEGDRIVVVASQPIRRGQEVSDNYGMHFLTSSRSIRRNWLQVEDRERRELCFTILLTCISLQHIGYRKTIINKNKPFHQT